MLKATEEFFGQDDILAIKTWLKQPGAALFRRAIENEIAKLQIDASNKMLKGIEPDMARFEGDAVKILRRVSELQHALAELDRAQSVDFKPFVTQVVTI